MRAMQPRVSLTQFAQSSPLFTLEELGHRYGKKKPTRSVRNMLYRLKRQGRVRQLTKGVYAGALASASVNRYGGPGKLRKDAVVAFHSALELHGVANQVFQTVYYLSVRPRRDVVFDGVTYHCVAPPRQLVRAHRLDFQVELSRDKVRVTGRERSIVDCLASLPYSGGVDELGRTHVKLDAAYVKRTADATGFDAVQLEKVIRLRQLLIEFRKHPFLRETIGSQGRNSCKPFLS